MHILIAPNAFKNSLDAKHVALAIEEGLKQSGLSCTTELFPIADGGDGTGRLIIEKCNGERMPCQVHDPLCRKISSSFGFIDSSKTAVIEMADASGLRLLKKEELNPMLASSFGTGELVKAALDKGVKRIVIAMGGSATVDGGCGILNALGIEFFHHAGNKLDTRPEQLINMTKVDTTGLDARIYNTEIIVLCDVSNNLLGPQGAAAIFGPQKGASPEDVKTLDNFLENFVKVTAAQTGRNMNQVKYGGAAGGASAGLYAWLGAELVNGIEYFLKLTNFEDALKTADLVITGEGSLDSQTLQGKGPYGVAVAAKQKGVKVVGLAGKVEASDNLSQYFDELICINRGPFDVAEAMKHTRENLVRTAKGLGDKMA